MASANSAGCIDVGPAEGFGGLGIGADVLAQFSATEVKTPRQFWRTTIPPDSARMSR